MLEIQFETKEVVKQENVLLPWLLNAVVKVMIKSVKRKLKKKAKIKIFFAKDNITLGQGKSG